ncbi:MAG: hypothetical protein WDO14_06720 [Bacteroidota bacterium]
MIVFILLAFTFGSCAFFRYHSMLVEKPDRKIQNVAVLIFIQPHANEELTDNAQFEATKAAAEQLSDLHAFDFLILERDLPLTKINDIASDLRGEYDAYITLIVSNRVTTRVTLEMRETNSKNTLLIQARHSVSGSTDEAVRGTIDLFAKQWKAIR